MGNSSHLLHMEKAKDIEKQWVEFGYPCMIVPNRMLGFRCGYVGVPVSHIFHGSAYNYTKYLSKKEILSTGWSDKLKVFLLSNPDYGLLIDDIIQVHGGLTFSEYWEGPELENKDYWTKHWFFGYDCGHYTDKMDINLIPKNLPEDQARFIMQRYKSDKGTVRTLKYCVDQCKSLARQLHFLMNGEIRQEIFTKRQNWYDTLEP